MKQVPIEGIPEIERDMEFMKTEYPKREILCFDVQKDNYLLVSSCSPRLSFENRDGAIVDLP